MARRKLDDYDVPDDRDNGEEPQKETKRELELKKLKAQVENQELRNELLRKKQLKEPEEQQSKQFEPIKHPGGRPPTYTDELISEIIEKIEQYTDENEIPIVAEFAYLNDIRKATLYEKKEFAYAVKRMTEKKEANLEKKGLSGDVTPSIAIFSLKQLGWSDKQELQHTTVDDEGNQTGILLSLQKAYEEASKDSDI